jgi:hypothetical protein
MEDQTALSVWFCIVWPAALLAGLITTVLGFIMNLHFREREKYETGFSEMDYVVATALRDISNQKRELLQKAKARASVVEEVTKKEKSSDEQSKLPELVDPDAGIGVDTVPFAVLRKLSPKGARDRQRHMFIGGKYLKDPRFSPYLHLPPLDEVIGDFNRIPVRKTKKLSKLTPTSTASISAKESELMFATNKPQRIKHVMSTPELKSPNYSSLVVGSSSSCRLQERNQLLPGELDPDKFQRSVFKPMVAWLMSGGVLFTAFLTFLVMGPIGATATVEANLFTMIFIATYLTAWLTLCFVYETVKIALMAFFYAYNDWKLYQLIGERCIIPKDLGFQYRL